MTTPTSEQIATERQFLNAARLIAEDYHVTVRESLGALVIQLPGCENPRLIVVADAQPNGRVSMEVQRIDDNDSQAPTALTIIGADGDLNQYWAAGLRHIIANHGGESR